MVDYVPLHQSEPATGALTQEITESSTMVRSRRNTQKKRQAARDLNENSDYDEEVVVISGGDDRQTDYDEKVVIITKKKS